MPSRQDREELVTLMQLQEERRKSDPLITWEPHAKQRQFIQAVLGRGAYENWALWANRAGKSDVGAFCGASLARYGNPDPRPAIGPSATVWDRATSGWVVALDTPSSVQVIQPKYFDNGFIPGGMTHAPFIPPHEVEKDGWSVTNQILRLRNGSIIGFKSCESGRKKFQGTEKDWIHFDEEPPKDIYTECTIRVGGGRRLRVFGTCTLLPPEGQIGGVTWVFTDIVQPFRSGKLSGVGVYQAGIYDNPHIDREEIKRLEAKYPEGSVERRIRLNGELLPGLSGARAYGAFSRDIHVVEFGPIEPRRPLCWALDFNVSPMVSLVGQYHGDTFYVHEELIQENGSVMEMAQWFQELHPTHQAEIWVYGDATGKARDAQTGKSDYALIMNVLRQYPVPVRLRVPESNPHVPDRVNAMNRALKDEHGRIGMLIHPRCEEIIGDLEGVLRDPRGGIKKTYNAKDSYFRRTHTSDALGYWVCAVRPVTNEPLKPKPDVQGLGHTTVIKSPGFRRR